MSIVTTTNVHGASAAAAGGDRASVSSLVNDPAADPHSFEATPADATKVADARILVKNGGAYDDFADKLAAGGNGERAVIDVVELSGLKPAGSDEFNEHGWYSLPTVTKLADTPAADLAAADPQGADAYKAGAAAFAEKIKGLEQRSPRSRTSTTVSGSRSPNPSPATWSTRPAWSTRRPRSTPRRSRRTPIRPPPCCSRRSTCSPARRCAC